MSAVMWALTLLGLAICATAVLLWIADDPAERGEPREVWRAR